MRASGGSDVTATSRVHALSGALAIGRNSLATGKKPARLIPDWWRAACFLGRSGERPRSIHH
jgi:hypothetical protein